LISGSKSIAVSGHRVVNFSIIIPTYNESANILRLINEIEKNVCDSDLTEVVIVDDNSPDGTGEIVHDYILQRRSKDKSSDRKLNSADNVVYENSKIRLKVIHRVEKNGLIPAIIDGVKQSYGKNVVVMDADFSHPPEVIPQMMDQLRSKPDTIIVASRYTDGGKVVGWPIRRRILSSGASTLARLGLNVRQVKDPMSGFFALRRELIESITIDTKGYKILLEILVKHKNTPVQEIPYTFTDRQSGASKMDTDVVTNYLSAVWHLYRYGQKSSKSLKNEQVNRKSVIFLSKAGRYYTVGLTGLVINYLISFVLANDLANSLRLLSNIWYIEASIIGAAVSITSNFLLNKIWTFEDRDYSIRQTIRQYLTFGGISAIGILIQTYLLYVMVENMIPYRISLVIAISVATTINFVLNMKLTFKEKVWT
jgi:dolichol-phosphate mannosyltransferase